MLPAAVEPLGFDDAPPLHFDIRSSRLYTPSRFSFFVLATLSLIDGSRYCSPDGHSVEHHLARNREVRTECSGLLFSLRTLAPLLGWKVNRVQNFSINTKQKLKKHFYSVLLGKCFYSLEFYSSERAACVSTLRKTFFPELISLFSNFLFLSCPYASKLSHQSIFS